MVIGIVTGKLWATAKAESMKGYKLLLVKEMDNRRNRTVIAADYLDAGIGERVLITGGSSARIAGGSSQVPIDATIVAILDEKKESFE